jgi:hypothetical protein
VTFERFSQMSHIVSKQHLYCMQSVAKSFIQPHVAPPGPWPSGLYHHQNMSAVRATDCCPSSKVPLPFDLAVMCLSAGSQPEFPLR